VRVTTADTVAHWKQLFAIPLRYLAEIHALVDDEAIEPDGHQVMQQGSIVSV
jgi:hypothetical protein